jgi:hypothetical protein
VRNKNITERTTLSKKGTVLERIKPKNLMAERKYLSDLYLSKKARRVMP